MGPISWRNNLTFRHPGQDRLDPAFGSMLAGAGQPLTITSGYRDPAYNARVGGAKQSMHVHGQAADIDMSGMSPEERLELIQKLRASGVRRFGAYSKTPNMLHVDTSDAQGGSHFMYDRTAANMGDAPEWFRAAASVDASAPPAQPPPAQATQQPPQAQPQGGAPMQGPPMIDPGFSLPSSQPLDLSPIEVDETPSFASAMASNPFLMMGLGILGSGDIGKGAMQGLLAASQAETNATKRNEFKIDQEYKRRQQQILENQNRMAEQKMWGAGAMNAAEQAREAQSMRTHERELTNQQLARTTNPVMMQLADGTVAPVVYDKQTGTMRQVTEGGMGEPVQVLGPAPKAAAGGAGTKKDKDLAKVENAMANLDILEAMAFGDGQTPGIFQGRQRGAEGRITSLIGDTRQALTGDDPRYKAYNDFSGGTMASLVKGLGDTGSIAVAEQERAKALLPKTGWDGDTTDSARLKVDMLRTLLGNWKARGEALKNGQEPPPPLTVAEVQAQRAGQVPAPMSAMPPQANPGAGGMLPGGTQALPGAPQVMPPQAGGARRFIYNPNTGKLEAR